jgi:molybdopterin molybdotransferase
LIEAAADHIRRRGENYRSGDVLLPKGSVLTPSRLSLAASSGATTLSVKRPFKVAILPSGDELVKPGAALGPGQLYESNSLALAGMVERLGHHAIVLPIVRDDIDATRSALDFASQSDVILTSGGISMGEADHIRALMESEGEVDFWRISMKPGGPPLFGAWRGTPIFGLPGNPVSTQVVFILLVAPWLAASQGAAVDDLNLTARRVPVVVEESFRANRKKQTFPRVIVFFKNNKLIAISPSHQGSGNTLNMALANAILDIPAGVEIPAGSIASALLFD